MSLSRFSKLSSVVLALALWAGTAYSQSLTANPTTWAPSYTIGSETNVNTPVGVTASSDGATYAAASDAVSWLSCTAASGTANIAAGETVTIALIDSGADALTAGSHSGHCNLTATGNVSGTPDAIVTVTLLVVPVAPSATTASLTYAKNGGSSQASATAHLTITDAGGPDSYTYASGTCPAWILFSSAHSWAANSTQADTLSIAVDSTSSTVNGMDSGSGSCIAQLVYASTNVAAITVNYTINNPGGSSASPLSLAVAGPVAMTYIKFTGASVTSTAIINSLDSASEALTVAFSGGTPAPPWLTAVPTTSFTTASIGSPGKVTFTIATGASMADIAAAGSTSYTVNVSVPGQPVLAVTLNVTITAQALSFMTSSAALTYTTGTSATSIVATPAPKAQSTSGTVAFTSDAATLPWWLNAVSGSATTAGSNVTLQGVPSVLTGMSVGNYTANVGFWATTTPAKAIPEFYLTVTLSVTSAASTISMGTIPAAVIVQPGSTVPTPTIMAVSSLADVGFTIGCAATSTYPGYTPQTSPLTGCTLKIGANPAAPSVTGIAYTWGTPLSVIIDPNLFSSSTAFGSQVVVTVTMASTTNGSTPPAPMVFTYNFQPVAATLAAVPVAPAATPQGGTTPVVVTLSGANFVSQSNINPSSSLVPTEVFISSTASASGVVSAWTLVAANVTVVSSSVVVVTIPSASLPTFVPSATLTTAKLYIGVANQTGATAPNPSVNGFQPDAHASLDVTTNPVIEAITSTATYNQPTPGNAPNVAPYELVSIFGANFGATSNVIAAPDATYNKYPTSLTVGTSGGKSIVMKVTFTGTVTTGGKATATTYTAPILFASANQINVVAPSGLDLGGLVQVAVSSSAAAIPPVSDNFAVKYVAADPGVFTLSAQGSGQGAIINNTVNNVVSGSVNGMATPAYQGVDTIELYLTGLGTPNSTAADATSNSGLVYPTNCVSPSSYLTLVNTSVTTGTKYTAPTPVWTGLEGALMMRVLGGLPPCMLNTVAGTTVTVTFNGGTPQAATYAGFVDDAVAGLYQVNVPVPSGLTTALLGTIQVPVTVTIGTLASPPVLVAVHN